MKKSSQQYFEALPAYAGGKRKLCRWMFGLLAQICPPQKWRDLTFADAFAGGGAVSLFAKAQGFGALKCNDWSQRSQIVLEGLIANQAIRLTDMDLARLFTPLEGPETGFVSRELQGQVFSARHAAILNTVWTNAIQFACPTKQALGKLLLWHLVHQSVAFGTSVGTSNRPFAEVLDGKRAWWELNPKRLQDGSMAHLIQPIWPLVKRIQKRINAGVFASRGPVVMSQQNVFDFVRDTHSDVLYLDPPYPSTTGYEHENYVLDAVLQGHFPSKDIETSPFSQGTEALSDLLQKSQHVPIWMLSYGNKVIDLDGLVDLVQKARSRHTVHGFAKSYRHLAHVSKNTNNQELLVISVDQQFQSSLDNLKG